MVLQLYKSESPHLHKTFKHLRTNYITFAEKAAVTLYALQNKVVISNEIKELLQSSDNMYTPEEGNELFESLERFDKFPEGMNIN